MSKLPVYSVDTSALLDGLERYYPAEIFSRLWEGVDELVDQGRFFVSEEVWEEACVHNAATKNWLEGHGKANIAIPTDATVATDVATILRSFPRLVANMKGRNRADAFVIAVAKQHGAVVITGEGSDGNENRPKIPFICDQLNIPCQKLLDVIRAEGWKF